MIEVRGNGPIFDVLLTGEHADDLVAARVEARTEAHLHELCSRWSWRTGTRSRGFTFCSPAEVGRRLAKEITR